LDRILRRELEFIDQLDSTLEGTLRLLESIEQRPCEALVTTGRTSDPRLPVHQGSLADLRRELRYLKRVNKSLRLESARACKAISGLKAGRDELKSKLTQATAAAAPPHPQANVPTGDLAALRAHFLSEMIRLQPHTANQRNDDDDDVMCDVCLLSIR
jgi:hypothetical protein